MSILSLVNAACTRLIESGIRPEEAGLDAEVWAVAQRRFLLLREDREAGVGQELLREVA